MVSNVDVTKPPEGNALTKDVRNNFSIIKTEIESLQLGYLPLSGGVMTGAIVAFTDPAGPNGKAGITTKVNMGVGGILKIQPNNGFLSGGSLTLAGGDGEIPGVSGGYVKIIGGFSKGSLPPGEVLIQGGLASADGVKGANVNIRGGFGKNNDPTLQGDILITNLKTVPQAADVIWNHNEVLNIGAGAALVTIEHLDELKETIETLTRRIVLLEAKLPAPGE